MPQRPVTVMQVLPELESGGVERGTLELAEELVRRGHRSLVVSGGGRLVESLEEAGSTHITASVGKKSPLTLRHVGWLRRLLVRERIDILHVRSRVPAWVAWLAWKKLPESRRPRFVTTVHGRYSVSRFSEIMTRGERVIAVSRTIRDYIRENYPRTPESAVETIYRGVDPADFPRGYRPLDKWRKEFFQAFPAAQGRRLITLPGRLTRLKGHMTFLETVAELKRDGIDAHGLIVGDVDPRRQSYADEVQAKVLELGLRESVSFTGHRSDMKEIYSISDLVLSLSSQPESFGRTVLEALNLGVPVVGYAHGGVGEILDDLFPEGAVPVGAREAVIARTAELLKNPVDVAPVEKYRLSEMLDQTIGLYERIALDASVTHAA